MLTSVITVIHIFVCVLLVLIVLLQQGKGADMGAAFGGGSNTLFGASGADNLLTRVTTVTALVFMCTSVYLAASMRVSPGSNQELFKGAAATTTSSAATSSAATSTATTSTATLPAAESTPAPAAPPASAGQATGTITGSPSPANPANASETKNEQPPQSSQANP